MFVNAIKNFAYAGRLVAVDTKFSISCSSLEALMKRHQVVTWNWKLRDGVAIFSVPQSEVEYLRGLFLRQKILAIIL